MLANDPASFCRSADCNRQDWEAKEEQKELKSALEAPRSFHHQRHLCAERGSSSFWFLSSFRVAFFRAWALERMKAKTRAKD